MSNGTEENMPNELCPTRDSLFWEVKALQNLSMAAFGLLLI